MLTNYPAGAQYDPTAPWLQATVEDRGCRFEHADDEKCGGDADFECARCKTACCENVLVQDRVTALGRTIIMDTCIDCAERLMVPGSPAEAILLLYRSIDHAMAIPGMSIDEFLDTADIFIGCAGWVAKDMAERSRKHTDAVLRLGRVA